MMLAGDCCKHMLVTTATMHLLVLHAGNQTADLEMYTKHHIGFVGQTHLHALAILHRRMFAVIKRTGVGGGRGEREMCPSF